ncbi:MAG: hypothetical protein EBQ96_02220 [Proteobacteria bacterium]|nr:hypothetical protein [Pseudomonadota bacterium]
MSHHESGDFPLQRFRQQALPDIMFSDVLPYLQRGAKDREIFESFPDLAERQLLKARAYYQAKVVKPARKRPMRALCDENISKRHVISCQKHFSFATSIAIEKMSGTSDQDVWNYACAEGYDFIVTHDQRHKETSDLTRIAVHAWHEALTRRNEVEGADAIIRLPVILHLTGKAAVPKKFGKILKRNLKYIFTQRATLSAPVIRMNESGVFTKIGLDDLLTIVVPQSANRDHLRRQEQWARYYLRRVLPEHKWADRESPQVVHVKRMITRAVAMASSVPHGERLTHRRNRAA